MTVGTRSAERDPWKSLAWRSAIKARRTLWGVPSASLRAKPDFLLIGAQRSGTTSLYRYLQDHPDVRWPAFVKGPHWFDVHYQESMAWYRSHFPMKPLVGKRSWQTAEACPYYLFHPAVPGRIADRLPDAKLVVVVREPVSRAWSHFQHERARGFEELDFATAVATENERIAPELARLDDPSFVGHHHRHHSYVSRGMYADQIDRYLHHFPREQLLVLTSDELKTSTQKCFDAVCDFLELERMTLGPVPAHNARSYERLDDDVAAHLRQTFAEPNQRLRVMLDHPLPDWS